MKETCSVNGKVLLIDLYKPSQLEQQRELYILEYFFSFFTQKIGAIFATFDFLQVIYIGISN